jgi:putative protease
LKSIHLARQEKLGHEPLEAPLAVGEKVSVLGNTTHFEEVVQSMQIEHKEVERAAPGQSIGLKVCGRVREGDLVCKQLHAVS